MSPSFTGGPTMLGGICFCGLCGRAMTLRTGKSGKYRYYTCSTLARAGKTGCGGISVPMDRLDDAVANLLEIRILDPVRLAALVGNILDRRDQWLERRRAHSADLRKIATEAEAKLQRVYIAIEDGLTDPSDRSLQDRIKELRTKRDAAEEDAVRAAQAIDNLGPAISPEIMIRFAQATWEMLRNEDGTYRRDLLRAVAKRVEVHAAHDVRVLGTIGSSRAPSRRTMGYRGRLFRCPELYRGGAPC
jgi:site-specific DNA recombinase